jgi:exosortase
MTVILWIVAIGGALAWLYGATFQQLLLSWRDDEYYSHGPLLPFISAYLIWGNRVALQRAWNPGTGMKAGFVLLLIGLGIAFFGLLVDINFVRAFSIPVVLLALSRIIGGGQFERQMRFPILLLAAAVPISRVVVQTFSVPLQKMAAGGASLLLGVTGLSVENDGVNIFTPLYNFVVDVPCSGLKTATALLTVGLVVSYVMTGLSNFQRVILALSSVFVALLTNVLRIIFIILIGTYYGREAAEGFLHGFSNVVTLVLSLIFLMLIGTWMQRRNQDQREQEEEERSEMGAHEVANQAASSPQTFAPIAENPPASSMLPRLSAHVSGRVFACVLILLIATHLLGSRAIVPEEVGPKKQAVANLQLPALSGAWSGQPVKVDAAVFEMLRPDAAVQKRYTLRADGKSSRDWVDAIVIYSSDSRGFHAPEICLRAGGWTINDRQSRVASYGNEKLPLTLVTGERKNSRTHLAYYFANTQSQASGWAAMLFKEALGRAMKKNTGSLEVQFAFSHNRLDSNGELSPELSQLILDVSRQISSQLASSSSS